MDRFKIQFNFSDRLAVFQEHYCLLGLILANDLRELVAGRAVVSELDALDQIGRVERRYCLREV